VHRLSRLPPWDVLGKVDSHTILRSARLRRLESKTRDAPDQWSQTISCLFYILQELQEEEHWQRRPHAGSHGARSGVGPPLLSRGTPPNHPSPPQEIENPRPSVVEMSPPLGWRRTGCEQRLRLAPLYGDGLSSDGHAPSQVTPIAPGPPYGGAGPFGRPSAAKA
ncbi:unnamed protein product, partial [Pleuronectes platessa]